MYYCYLYVSISFQQFPLCQCTNYTCLFYNYRSKYFRGRKIFGDWDIRVEQVITKDQEHMIYMPYDPLVPRILVITM
jgi:hypothetical protein